MATNRTLTTQMNALVNLYVKLYKEHYDGEAPANFNRHRDKWGFQSMIEDLGYNRAQEVVAYYFETKHLFHPATTLLYEYDRLDKIMKERAADDKRKAILLEESRKRVEEWRNRRSGNTSG